MNEDDPERRPFPQPTDGEDQHPLRAANTVVDIAEELDSLIPDDLIESPRSYGGTELISLKGIERLYLLAIIVEVFLLSSSYIESYSMVASLVFFIVCPLVTATWIYIVKRNSLVLGAGHPSLSPAVSAILMIIPVFNSLAIWPVFQELWKMNRRPDNWDNERNSVLISLWWILRLVALYLVFVSAFKTNACVEARNDSLIVLYVIPCSIMASMLQAVIAVIITRMQQANILRHSVGTTGDTTKTDT